MSLFLIVMDHESVPRDSPPPYSEIDPMKQQPQPSPALERPSSLEIPASSTSNENVEGQAENDDKEVSEGDIFVKPFFTLRKDIFHQICIISLQHLFFCEPLCLLASITFL